MSDLIQIFFEIAITILVIVGLFHDEEIAEWEQKHIFRKKEINDD